MKAILYRTFGIFLCFLGMIILLQVWAGPGTAEITVDDDGGADYLTISDAVMNATEGDTIRVYAGNYSESFEIGKSISIIGNGTNTTDLDGDDATVIIRIVADDVTIQGLTIHDGDTGVKIEGDDCVIFDVLFYGNDLYGIHHFQAENANIQRCGFNENTESGILLEQSGHNIITTNHISSNDGNGITLKFSSHNYIRDNTVGGNGGSGIQLQQFSEDNTISYNEFNGNDIGITVKGESEDNHIHYNTIQDCTSYGIHALDDDQGTVDATHNFWGDDYGPYHPDLNSGSSNDKVTDNVDFSPWVDANLNELFYEFTITTDGTSDTAKPKEFLEFPLTITNTGNLTDNITLRAEDVPEDLVVFFPDREFTGDLQPDSSVELRMLALINKDASPGPLSFDLAASPGSNPPYEEIVTFDIDVNQTFNVSVVPSHQFLSIDPGYNKTTVLTITNTGTHTDYFTLDVTNIEGIVVDVSDSITPFMDADDTFDVAIDFDVDGSMEPGTHSFTITITSEEAEEEGLTIFTTEEIDIRIEPRYEVSLSQPGDIFSVEPAYDSAGAQIFTLTVWNDGTAEDTFDFEFANDSATQRYKRWVTLPDSFTLQPDQQAVVQAEISVPPHHVDPDAVATSELYEVIFRVYSREARDNNEETEGRTTDEFQCNIDIEEYRHASIISIVPESLVLDPEDVRIVNVTLENQGNSGEQYSLIVDGKEGTGQFTDWYYFNVESVFLGLGERTNVTIIVEPTSDAPVGIHDLEFHAKSEKTYVTDTEEFRVDIEETFGGEFVSGDEVMGYPGNKVTLHITVRNTGNAHHTFYLDEPIVPAEWEASFSGGATKEIAADSMGTFTISIDIPPNGIYAGMGTYEIRVYGDHEIEGGGSEPLAGYVTLTVHVQEWIDLELDSSDTSSGGKPGEQVAYQLEITNTGNVNESYTFSVIRASGYPDAKQWVTIQGLDGDNKLFLEPGEYRTLDILVDIPEFTPNDDDAEADDYRFKVKAKAVSDYQIEDEVVFDLEVEKSYGIGMWGGVTEEWVVVESCCETSVSFAIHVRNLANTDDEITLSVPEEELTGEKDGWVVLFGGATTRSVDLESLQQTSLLVDIIIDSDTAGGDYQLRVQGRSDGGPLVTVNVTYVIHVQRAVYDMEVERTGTSNPVVDPSEGSEVEFTFTVTNTGSHDDSFTVEVMNSLNSGIYKGWSMEFVTKAKERVQLLHVPAELKGFSGPYLASDQEAEISFFVMPPWDQEQGYFKDILITIISDSDPLRIKVLSFDLTVVRSNIRVRSDPQYFFISQESEIMVGNDIDVTARIFNNGSAASGEFYVFLYNGAGDSPPLTDGYYIAYQFMDSIPAGSYWDVTFTWEDLPVGENDLFLYADKPIRNGLGETEIDGSFSSRGLVLETDESDNTASISSSYRRELDLRPDLTVKGVEFTDKTAGSSSEVTVTVANVGRTPLEPGDASVRVQIDDSYLKEKESSSGVPVIGEGLTVGDEVRIHYIWTVPDIAGNLTVEIAIHLEDDLNQENNTNTLVIQTTGGASPSDGEEDPEGGEDDGNKAVYVGLGMIIGIFLGVLLIILLLRMASTRGGEEGPDGYQDAEGDAPFRRFGGALVFLNRLVAPRSPSWDGADMGPEPGPDTFAPPSSSSLSPQIPSQDAALSQPPEDTSPPPTYPSSSTSSQLSSTSSQSSSPPSTPSPMYEYSSPTTETSSPSTAAFSPSTTSLFSGSDSKDCPRCGIPLNPGSQFCIACGYHGGSMGGNDPGVNGADEFRKNADDEMGQ